MVTLCVIFREWHRSGWLESFRECVVRALCPKRKHLCKSAVFVCGFPKSGLANIRDDEQEQFKKAARVILALSDEQIHQLVENGQFEEVNKDG
jgi:hypothetical protein